ncbi:RNase H family protein [Hibiscus syriacus]|uniref:RNase H family protein n=1 Tax=Hibiscus syriacus TaxID=106335 RepID=A0A6A3AK88_HIBSY|nr:RNase H family protein [Hibiscus syriacus]
MAADVSYLHRVLSWYKDDRMTRNASGGCSALINMKNDILEELNLDVQVPNGWEKRLDLKSSKVYLQSCNSSNSSQSSDGTKHQINQTMPKLQDLNFPPSKTFINLFNDTNLELKLVSSSSTTYQSVCTLDKVSSSRSSHRPSHGTVEMVEKHSIKRRSPSSSSSSLWKSSLLSPSYSSPPIKGSRDTGGDQERLFASPVAADCPGCLSYVMIMKLNPRCPTCNTLVQLPASKKPCIYLNISI